MRDTRCELRESLYFIPKLVSRNSKLVSKQMKKETLIKQHDIKDCGAACLASVSAHYGLKIPIAKIRQICHTDKRGTNVLGMVQGLEALGFNAKGVKMLDEKFLFLSLHTLLKKSNCIIL